MNTTNERVMEPEEAAKEGAEAATKKAPGKKAAGRKLSRVERLKQKVRKLQGKNPDIYPMW